MDLIKKVYIRNLWFLTPAKSAVFLFQILIQFQVISWLVVGQIGFLSFLSSAYSSQFPLFFVFFLFFPFWLFLGISLLVCLVVRLASWASYRPPTAVNLSQVLSLKSPCVFFCCLFLGFFFQILIQFLGCWSDWLLELPIVRPQQSIYPLSSPLVAF